MHTFDLEKELTAPRFAVGDTVMIIRAAPDEINHEGIRVGSTGIVKMADVSVYAGKEHCSGYYIKLPYPIKGWEEDTWFAYPHQVDMVFTLPTESDDD